MRQKVGYRHLAGKNKSHRTGKEAHKKQRAATELQNSRKAEERHEPHIVEHRNMRKAKELCRPMLDKEQSRDNPQKAEDARLPRGCDLSERLRRALHDRFSPMRRLIVVG